jgi:hypothetical protein
MGCGCGGGDAAQTAGQAQAYAVLVNNTKMGNYPTAAHAEVAKRTVYRGQGTVVPR